MGTEDREIVRCWHGDQIPGIVEEQNHQRIQTLCKCFEDFTVTGVEPCTLKREEKILFCHKFILGRRQSG